MAKKRVKRGASTHVHEPAPSIGKIVAGVVPLFASGVMVFVAAYPWMGPWPLVIAPALVGAIVGLSVKNYRFSATLGGVIAFFGSLFACMLYTMPSLQALASAMPEWANPDIPQSVYTDFAFPVLAGNPVIKQGPALVILVAVVVTAGVAALVSVLARQNIARIVTPWILVAVVVASFFGTAMQYSTPARASASVEPANRAYAYDAMVYLKAYYEMKAGKGYYPAVVDATANDSRYAQQNLVRGGKMFGFWTTPAMFRQPAPFYLWKYIAPNGGWIYIWSFVLSAVLLVGLYWGFEPHIGVRAAFIPMFAVPWFLMHTMWINVVFPDWWGAIFVMASAIFLVRGMPIPAAVAAFVATQFRFTALPLLGLILVVTAVLGWWNRKLWIAAGTCIALLAAFYLLWLPHVRSAANYIDPATMQAYKGGAISATGGPLSHRLLAPTAYLMFPYGMFAFPVAALFFTGIAGFVLGLRRNRVAQLTLALYLAAWLAFALKIGITSSYWGQVYTGLLVVGSALLLASLGYLADLPADFAGLRSKLQRPQAT